MAAKALQDVGFVTAACYDQALAVDGKAKRFIFGHLL